MPPQEEQGTPIYDQLLKEQQAIDRFNEFFTDSGPGE